MHRVLAVLSAALVPSLTLAEQAGGQAQGDAPSATGSIWPWLVAAVAVILALLRMFFGGPGRSEPPGRRP